MSLQISHNHIPMLLSC